MYSCHAYGLFDVALANLVRDKVHDHHANCNVLSQSELADDVELDVLSANWSYIIGCKIYPSHGLLHWGSHRKIDHIVCRCVRLDCIKDD